MVERISKFFGGLVRRFAASVYTPTPEEWQQMRQNDLATIAVLGKKIPIGERNRKMDKVA
jgi:3-methyladenine DNA glycosylase/8-oxoguanine DNA glycosylase